MPDLSLSVSVTRTLLGLADLEVNDHVHSYVTPTFLGADRGWNRVAVTSPWLDGDVTVNRTRQKVTESLQLEVLGESLAEMDANALAILDAFDQSDFTITVTVGGQAHTYECEAADRSVLWTGPRMISSQLQITFQVPRQPVPLAGAY